MKKLFLIGLILGGGILKAQDAPADTTPKMQTLLGSAKLRYIGLYFNPEGQYSRLQDNHVWSGGGSWGIILNRKWSIGAFGMRTPSTTVNMTGNTASLQLNAMQGGGQVEYTFSPLKLVHFSVPVQFGGMTTRIDSVSGWGGRRDFGGRDFNASTQYFVQPNLRMEVNVSRFAKLYVGAGYRFGWGDAVSYPATGGLTTTTLAAADLSSLTAQAGIKVGIFDYDLQKKRSFGFKKRKHRGREE